MHLVVGLGNPGRQYERSRHNMGFMVVDALAVAHGLAEMRAKFGGLFSRGAVGPGDVALLKPQTFMNLSGESVQAAAAWLKVAPSGIIVIHDELDLPWKTVRLKLGGGHAGHNGLRSIIQHLGSAEFARVRVGIGRPPAAFASDVSAWVLSGLDASQDGDLPSVIERARDAVVGVLSRAC
ncbi:MAG: aminoacyl-tRNA hydrolase [Polyangiaceae bacterium]